LPVRSPAPSDLVRQVAEIHVWQRLSVRRPQSQGKIIPPLWCFCEVVAAARIARQRMSGIVQQDRTTEHERFNGI
jgi:hypothetical protein